MIRYNDIAGPNETIRGSKETSTSIALERDPQSELSAAEDALVQHGLRVDHHVLPQLQFLGEAAMTHLNTPTFSRR